MTWEVRVGDCRALMAEMDANSVDSIVCDPPYGLSKEPDMSEVLRHWLAGDDYVHTGSGFMGKSWDSFVPGPAIWKEAYRVLKPGGHLIAFFGTRTYDLGAIAIRLAGFECRDMGQWCYGSGFPKSHDISKAIDKAAGAEREIIGTEVLTNDIRGGGLIDSFHGENRPALVRNITVAATEDAKRWRGWGTALKPAFEPWILARKPLGESTVAGNVLKHGVGGLNIDGARISSPNETISNHGHSAESGKGKSAFGDYAGIAPHQSDGQKLGRFPANLIHDGSDEVLGLFPDDGGKSASRFFASFPMDEELCTKNNANYAESNFLQRSAHVGSALKNAVIQSTRKLALTFIDCRELSTSATPKELKQIETIATIAILNTEKECLLGWPQEKHSHKTSHALYVALREPTGITKITISLWRLNEFVEVATFGITSSNMEAGEADSPKGKLIYTAKASQWDRNGGLDDLDDKPSAASEFRPNHAEKAAMGEDGNPYGRWSPRKNIHPTVKPTDLMRYLCRLVTPPGGLVLDPFCGSGSTGRAALLEGFSFIGCELSEEYAEIARGRIAYVEKNKDRALVKPKPVEHNPYKIDLF